MRFRQDQGRVEGTDVVCFPVRGEVQISESFELIGLAQRLKPLFASVGAGQGRDGFGIEQTGQARDFHLGAGELVVVLAALELGEHLVRLTAAEDGLASRFSRQYDAKSARAYRPLG